MTSRKLLAAPLVAALAVLGASSALAQPLPAGVDDCLAKIEGANATAQRRTDATPAPTLVDLCPDIVAALEDNAWGKALAGVSPADLDTSEFVALTKLVARYESPTGGAARSAPPSARSLDDALAELKLEKPAPLTIWQRIQQWYDEHFAANGDDARGWLRDWLQRFAPSERFVGYFVILLGIVLVSVTVVIVHNELRVAGVFRRGVLRKYSPLDPSSEPTPDQPRDFDELARAPLARRPVLLLALVLERLRTRGVLASRDSLTHRELLRAARLSGSQSAAFGAVLDAAERVTFADWRPAEEEVDPVLAHGRELLSSLPAEVAPK